MLLLDAQDRAAGGIGAGAGPGGQPAGLASYRAEIDQATGMLTEQLGRWPRFAAAAGQVGFSAVQALPMRLRGQVIGALNLFRDTPGAFDADSVHVGQALADVATIGLLHERSMRRSDTLNEQLQTAPNSRVIIEQAKGKLAERLGIDVNQAFTLLRDQARNRNQRLSDLARAFVDGTQAITGSAQASHPGTRQPRPGPRPAP